MHGSERKPGAIGAPEPARGLSGQESSTGDAGDQEREGTTDPSGRHALPGVGGTKSAQPNNPPKPRGRRGSYRPRQKPPLTVIGAREVAVEHHGPELGDPESHLQWATADAKTGAQPRPLAALGAVRAATDRVVAPCPSASPKGIDPCANHSPNDGVLIPLWAALAASLARH
jgi:hypothetical protein